MSFTVMLSPDVRKYLDGLDAKRVKNIKKHLKKLEDDPFKPAQPAILMSLKAVAFRSCIVCEWGISELCTSLMRQSVRCTSQISSQRREIRLMGKINN